MLWSTVLVSAVTFGAHLVQGQYIEEQVYPSPNATGAGGWYTAFQKASTSTAQLNLAEKAFLVTGVEGPCVGNIAAVPRIGFKGLCLQDGPLAIRQVSYASVFPAGVSVAATWDRDLLYHRGVEMAAEFKGKGANVALGPVAGPLGRSALAGRNWEGFSPDPYLTGVAFAETIKGIQSQKVQACGKHFIGYEQETQRNPSTYRNGTIEQEAVSSNIDDRVIHELYLWPFAEGVKSGLSSIMCSYNRINETYACQNSKTLNGLLKDELGFQGYVVSDWAGTHSGVSSVLSGLDMDMPGSIGFENASVSSYFGNNITAMINNGSVPEARLNDMVRRILTPYYYLHQDSEDYPTVDLDTAQISYGMFGGELPTFSYPFNLGNLTNINRDVRSDHSDLIREIGGASAVLLKNTNNTLPLSKQIRRISVFGNDAADISGGPYDPENTIGVQAVGGGSGSGRFTNLVAPLEAIKQRNPQALVQYVTDNKLLTQDPSGTLDTVYPGADVCLVFLKTYATEGEDRTNWLLDDNSTAVVESVTSYGGCSETVVVSHSVGPNTLPWADNENITAIVAAHLPGDQAGNAIVDVLFGDVNPSGKLPYTIAYNSSDYNAPIVNFTDVDNSDPNLWQSNFTENLLIDYRHFDYNNITPRYEFGYGLSYTSFSVSNLQISTSYPSGGDVSPVPRPLNGTIAPPGGNLDLYTVLANVQITVQNTGKLAGRAVPQIYIGFPQTEDVDETLPTPVKVLRGFDRTELLQPQESVTLNFDLRRKDVSSWDVVKQEWVIPSGAFTVMAGWSSRDLPLNRALRLL
ncbi:putative beta-glucosidase G [Talaromyces atroroseus]|uniref:Probable beta-glucosidase G n=1 Tax=Talaromyces atroroseus TaxID=1441469 RepID=A0A225AAR8_TALAT|nr:putative beta-glucosidase G [Talaromyces atroroseus]OKL58091.1 putative beta-glucosidase G [Talaromyces atroroseus]